MKIAVVMPLAEQRGGGELMLLHLMQQGRSLGVDWLIVFLQDGPMVAQVRQLGVETRVIHSGRLRSPLQFVATIAALTRIVRDEQVTLVFAWMSYAQLYAGLAARRACVPAIWYQLGIPLDRGWLDKVATRIPAQGILACSQAGAEAQAKLRPARPMRVVYPGAELERFDPAALPSPADARRRLGLPEHVPLIGIVGRLQRWKGMHVLAEAMPKVLARYPDAHCVIVGGDHAFEPDYPTFLAGRIAALGLETKVTLAGLQSNVPEWMQALDVFVHASDREPFGIVIIEAMALGKPVVAGDAAGPREIITDGVDGLLTPYGDADALACAILRYLNDPTFAQRAGAAARRRALQFSTQIYARNFVEAVQSLMSQGTP